MIPVQKWPEVGATLYRTFGFSGAARRARHEWRKAAGRFLDRPSLDTAPPPGSAHPFAVSPDALGVAVNKDVAIRRADRVAGGEYQAYRYEWRPLPSTSAAWLQGPTATHPWRSDVSWWEVPHFDRSGGGDIKDLWEPARFGWVFDLVRGYLASGDGRYSEAFERSFETWAESSPPFKGPHWACGQEAAIRAVALLYAEANLPLRRAAPSVSDTLYASGERISDAIGYAISQRNNHAISEATGLVALGCRFAASGATPEQWLERGHELIERLILQQFATDGWYIQHSFTYLRLALDQCVVAERCLRSVGRKLSSPAVERLLAAADLLVTLMETSTGLVPNHGPNDGAFVHPITASSYRDFRPVVTAVSGLWQHPLPPEVEPDGEALAWLGVPSTPIGARRQDGLTVGESGWAMARSGPFEIFLRAGSYRSRPGHVDPLHVDVRVDGREVIVDPGTFAYSAAPPWDNGLATHAVHNGPQIERRPPGIRGPRFLWYLWPSAKIVEATWNAPRAIIVAETPDGARRTVTVDPDHIEVADTVSGRKAHPWRVRWVLHPEADPERLIVIPAPRSGRGTDDDVFGWFSPHYSERLACHTLEVEPPPIPGVSVVTVILASDVSLRTETRP